MGFVEFITSSTLNVVEEGHIPHERTDSISMSLPSRLCATIRPACDKLDMISASDFLAFKKTPCAQEPWNDLVRAS